MRMVLRSHVAVTHSSIERLVTTSMKHEKRNTTEVISFVNFVLVDFANAISAEKYEKSEKHSFVNPSKCMC